MNSTSLRKLVILTCIVLLLPLSAVTALPSIDDDTLMVPEPFLELGTDGAYAILVDKSSSTVGIYQKRGEDVIKVASYRTSTGQAEGDKQVEGDLKTPEGVYYLVRIREDRQLLSKYGVRAFDLNYPNQFDKIDSKTGHGIWLHGTDEPERLELPRTSEGCVVVSNEDLKEISDYITLYRTPIIINDSVKSVSRAEAKNYRQRVVKFISEWLEAWSTQDFAKYKSKYAANFRGSTRRTKAWLNRKKMVFANTSEAEIEISDLRILKKDNHYTVSFYQRYKSSLMDDTGIKWVYIEDHTDGLKIVSEEWYSVGKALKGEKWNRKRAKIVEVVNDIADIEIDTAGKLQISNPTFSFPETRVEELAEKRSEAERVAEPEPEVVSGNSPIKVEGFRFTGSGEATDRFYLQLVNEKARGELKRGKLILVAEYENKKFASFPEVELDSGIPVSSVGGDNYGIKWFKELTASFNKPAGTGDLLRVRSYIFDEKSRLISDTELWKKQGE
jgi:murein L,D-transpeptidase YafK